MKEAQVQFSEDSLNLDGRVKRSEVKEIQKLGTLESETLKTTISTQKKLKTFLNTEYRWANENYMKPLKVSDMQKALHVVADNAFGSGTFQALIQFQKDHNLTTDGLCGPKTQAILLGNEENSVKIVEKNVPKKKTVAVQKDIPVGKIKILHSSGKKRSVMGDILEAKNRSTEKNNPEPSIYSGTIEKISKEYDIPSSVLIRLVNRENTEWNKFAINKHSNAYGLGQMIPSTWAIYGKGLNKHNPHHQLEASARYLRYIIDKNNCSPEIALAFYNAGDSFDYKSHSPVASNYIQHNAAVVNKIPNSINKNRLSKKDYFTGAIAYYNDLSFEQAKRIIL